MEGLSGSCGTPGRSERTLRRREAKTRGVNVIGDASHCGGTDM